MTFKFFEPTDHTYSIDKKIKIIKEKYTAAVIKKEEIIKYRGSQSLIQKIDNQISFLNNQLGWLYYDKKRKNETK